MDPMLAFHLDGDILSNSRTLRSVQDCASFDWHQSLQIEKGQGRSPDGTIESWGSQTIETAYSSDFHLACRARETLGGELQNMDAWKTQGHTQTKCIKPNIR
jgi:hypothetical protein